VVLLLVGAVGLYFGLRSRRRRRAKIGLELRLPRDAEERVPLGRETHEMQDYQDIGRRQSPVFEIGEEELDRDEPDGKRRD
jgi:hypothetical protein